MRAVITISSSLAFEFVAPSVAVGIPRCGLVVEGCIAGGTGSSSRAIFIFMPAEVVGLFGVGDGDCLEGARTRQILTIPLDYLGFVN